MARVSRCKSMARLCLAGPAGGRPTGVAQSAGPGRHAGPEPALCTSPLAKTPVTSAENIRKSSRLAHLKRHYDTLPPKATLACYFYCKRVREEGRCRRGRAARQGHPVTGDAHEHRSAGVQTWPGQIWRLAAAAGPEHLVPGDCG